MRFTFRQITALLLLVGFQLLLAYAAPKLKQLYEEDFVSGDFQASQLPSIVSSWALEGLFLVPALWAALGSTALRNRLLLGVCAVASLVYAWVFSELHLCSSPLPFPKTGVLGAFRMYEWQTSFLLVFGLLSLPPIRRRWRFTAASSSDEETTGNDRRFAIRDLLVWTAASAVILAVGGYLLQPDEDWAPAFSNLGYLRISLMSPLLNTLTLIPALLWIAICFDGKRRWRWLLLAILVTCLTTVASLALSLYYLLPINPQFLTSPDFWLELAGAFGTLVWTAPILALSAFISLLLLALGGWRLTRIDPAPLSDSSSL